MAQTTHRSQAHHPQAETHPPLQAAPPPPTPRMPMPAMMSLVTDRQLLEQLRQIFQTANRHLPVPASTQLSESLTDTLTQIAGIAEKAVEGYKP